MPLRNILAAIAIFVNGAKGYSALQLSRDLDCQYKTAFVLAHKLREAMGAEFEKRTLSGEVEVDGAYFGGYVKPENIKAERKDLRLKQNQSGIRESATLGTTVYADEASSWDELHASYDTHRVNHSLRFVDEGACTNQAESFFSRLRRAEVGTHHHISGRYLRSYANEMAWREDYRRVSNGEQYGMVVAAAMAHSVSRQWKGYWQRGN